METRRVLGQGTQDPKLSLLRGEAPQILEIVWGRPCEEMLSPQRAVSQKRCTRGLLTSNGLLYKMVAHVSGQGSSPPPCPLEKSGNNLRSYGFVNPSKAVTALIEEIHVNDRVIHQVLSNPRKVNQRGHIVGGELASWSDARQQQNLSTNVRLGDAGQGRLPT